MKIYKKNELPPFEIKVDEQKWEPLYKILSDNIPMLEEVTRIISCSENAISSPHETQEAYGNDHLWNKV